MKSIQGLEPEIVPSKFEETLPYGGFSDLHEYPVATATYKAVEVYERLVVIITSSYHAIERGLTGSDVFPQTQDPDDAPDLVIAGSPLRATVTS